MVSPFPRFCTARSGRMMRLVVGAVEPPPVSFFAPDAPQFAPSPQLHVAWRGDNFTFTDGAGPTDRAVPVLSGRASADPFVLEVTVGDAEVLGFGAANGAPTRNRSRFRVMNLDTMVNSIKGASYTSFPFFMVRTQSSTLGVMLATSFPLDVEVKGGKVKLSALAGTEGTPLDVVVFQGTAADIVEDLAALVGKTFLPPAWALGFHQSRWSYKTSEEVLEVAQRFRTENLPADVVHLDIHYMDQYRVFTWSPERFPQPAQMHQQLSTLGFRTMAIVDPGVSVADYRVLHSVQDEELLLLRKDGTAYEGRVWPGKTVFPDFSMPRAREAWGGFHKTLTDAGVSGIWNDMNDPVLKVGRDYDPMQEDITHQAGSHARMRNLYANDMARATVDGFKKLRPGKRPFVLSRSGFLGVQRHSALWTGDNHSSWDQLQENLHMVLNLGLCGVPLTGADVGGFAGRRGVVGGVKWRPPAELFVRWMELGALMPFFRVHCVLYAPRQEPWSFGKRALDLSRRILQQRYRMLPLLYRLAWDATQTGLPMVRPLWMHFDVPAGRGGEQFLLGESVLAAPVLHKGITQRDVWLPGGTWVDFHTGQRHEGHNVIQSAAPLGTCPLFVRAGAALFQATAQRNADDTLRAPLSLEISTPAKDSVGHGGLFLDDGETDSGARFLLDVTVAERAGGVDITLLPQALGFTPAQTHVELRVPSTFNTASVDGQPSTLMPCDLTATGRTAQFKSTRIPLTAKHIQLHQNPQN